MQQEVIELSPQSEVQSANSSQLGSTRQSQPVQECIYLWNGRLMLLLPQAVTARHHHLAASVLIGLDRPFKIIVDGQKEQTLDAAVIAPGVGLQLDSQEGPMLVLHIDPDHPSYQFLASRLFRQSMLSLPLKSFGTLPKRICESLMQPAGCDDASRLFAEMLACIGGSAEPIWRLDTRVATITKHLRAAAPEKVNLGDLAQRVGLSKSRLMHLFKAEMRVTIRYFLVSVRVQKAFLAVKRGVSLTDVAHQTGFYDLSHLFRAMRGYLGVSPAACKLIFSAGSMCRVTRCSSDDWPGAVESVPIDPASSK